MTNSGLGVHKNLLKEYILTGVKSYSTVKFLSQPLELVKAVSNGTRERLLHIGWGGID